jgi:hypothetical protein
MYRYSHYFYSPKSLPVLTSKNSESEQKGGDPTESRSTTLLPMLNQNAYNNFLSLIGSLLRLGSRSGPKRLEPDPLKV